MSVEAIFCTREYYTVDALSTIVSMKSVFGMKSHERLAEDIQAYKTALAEKIAVMLWDYTALAVFGEMRHARQCSNSYNKHVPQGGDRTGSYDKARKYTPDSILKAAMSSFDAKHNWKSGYGGSSWQKIAKCVSKRDIMDTGVFCDMCFSLSHNSGVYLNKGDANIFRIYSESKYKLLLDFKFEEKDIEKVIYTLRPMVTTTLKKLIQRAVVLGFIKDICFSSPPMDYIADEEARKLFGYKPIKWGTEELKDELVDKNVYADEPCSDEDEDEEEEEEVYKPKVTSSSTVILDEFFSMVSEPINKERGVA
jgi:hypothetical protein